MNSRIQSKLSISILTILHIVGFFGILSNHSSFFLKLSAANLIVSIIIVFANHQGWNRRFILFCFGAALATFAIEALGVKTGLIFGSYTYGKSLGYSLLNVPLLIGLNWVLLLYCASNFVDYFKSPQPPKGRPPTPLKGELNTKVMRAPSGEGESRGTLLVTTLMVFLDALMEPLSHKLGFWTWKDSYAPVQNYVAWFLIAWVLLVLYKRFKPQQTNKVAAALFVVQVVFFGLLNLFLH